MRLFYVYVLFLSAMAWLYELGHVHAQKPFKQVINQAFSSTV